MKIGQILTESSSKSSKETVNGSRALLPTCERLYKVLELKEGNMGALCRNLHTGKVMTIAINDLRPLSIPDLMHLDIDPNKAFKNHLDSRARNLWGKDVSEVVPQPSDKRETRSGRCFNAEIKPKKSILRKTAPTILSDYHLLDMAQLSACKAGVKVAKQLGHVLTDDQKELEAFLPRKSLTLSIIENGIKKMKSASKVKFDQKVYALICNENMILDLAKKEGIDRPNLNFSYFLSNLDISLNETNYLNA